MELDWVKKKLASPVPERRGLVKVGNPCISLRRQYGATQVAVRLEAAKLIFLMDADGVRNGRRQLLTDLSISSK